MLKSSSTVLSGRFKFAIAQQTQQIFILGDARYWEVRSPLGQSQPAGQHGPADVGRKQRAPLHDTRMTPQAMRLGGSSSADLARIVLSTGMILRCQRTAH